MQIAVIATIVVHLLLILWAPKIEWLIESHMDSLKSTDAHTSPIELDWISEAQSVVPLAVEPVKPVPLPPVEKKEKPPVPRELFPSFGVNPNAPDNTPDKTWNTSKMNQQVAQEQPTKETGSEIPLVKGEDADSPDIVTGDSAKSTFKATPSDYQKEVQAALAARRAETPLPGEEKSKNTDAPTPGSNIAKLAPNPSAAADKQVEGMPGASNTEGPPKGLYFKVDPKQPMQRQKLADLGSSARSTVLVKNEFGTANIGITASNSKWSQFGDYNDKMVDAVDAQFQRIFSQINTLPMAGTKVMVLVRLNALGEISEIVKVDGDADQKTRYACISSIVDRAPYGKWSDDMSRMLGKDILIQWTFYF